jgi:hypothetical protein
LQPRSVVVIGEPWLVDALVAGGIPADKVISDEARDHPTGRLDEAARMSHPTERMAVVASAQIRGSPV